MVTLRVLVLREGTHYVAQCLDPDVAGQGSDVGSALRELARVLYLRAVVAEEMGVEPFADLGPAPRAYQDAWERA